MIDKNILNKIEYAGTTNRIRSMQSSYLNRLLDFGRMARMIENEALNGKNSYSLNEMMNDLKNGIWAEIKNGQSIDLYRRNLQKSYISRLDYIMKNEQSVSSRSWSGYTTTIKVDVSDIRSVTMGILMDLNKDLSKALKKYSDKNIKNHIKYSMNMIQSALKSS